MVDFDRPRDISVLFIAEAPPKVQSGRFFFVESVGKHDSLFIELMKVLYPSHFTTGKRGSATKAMVLERFQSDGYYLIDALAEPMKAQDSRRKIKLLRACAQTLVNETKELVSDDTEIILISKTVYEACSTPLLSAGLNVINQGPLAFPGLATSKSSERHCRG